MDLNFVHPWLVMAAAALALGAAGLGAWRRRAAPVLFALGAAAFVLAAAGPRLNTAGRDVVHLAVLDVSDSMTPRLELAGEQLERELAGVALPPGHRVELIQLSDALRDAGAPVGGPTRYDRLADAASRPGFNGELVLLSDGRGEFRGPGLEPQRVILLPAQTPTRPDASVAAIRGPSVLSPGVTGILSAEIFCDSDAEVRWRVLRGGSEIASGVKVLRAGQAAGISANIVADTPGLVRLKVIVDLAQDRDPRNDSAELSVLVSGGRVIEYACDRAVPTESDALLALLRADTSNTVRVRHDLPASMAELEGAGLLVINDLSLAAAGATPQQLATIAQWVHAGGSVLMAGANGAFAPGGYRDTAIEDVMPVKFRPDDDPATHTLLLLDTSASMAEGTKLDTMKQAARRLLKSLRTSDSVAIVGFSSRLRREVRFAPAGNANQHEEAISALAADGQTRIRTSLRQAVDAMAPVSRKDGPQNRIVLITDGEEGDTRDDAAWRELGSRAAELGLRIDAVLTDTKWRERSGYDWLAELNNAAARPDVYETTVGERGFDELLARIEQVIAAGDRRLVRRSEMEVGGVNARLPVLVRTAPRKDDKATPILDAQTPRVRYPQYPLLAYRELVGRTGAICTETAGDRQVADFWRDPFWQEKVRMVLNLLLEQAGRPNLALNPLPEGAELVWIGAGQPPANDLRLSTGGQARRSAEGRWMLEAMPEGPDLRVFDGERMLQRIPLPRPVPQELARTGNDEVFFGVAEQSGYRVMSSLAAWQPRRWGESAGDKFALEWLVALAGVAVLITGFVLRRRSGSARS